MASGGRKFLMPRAYLINTMKNNFYRHIEITSCNR